MRTKSKFFCCIDSDSHLCSALIFRPFKVSHPSSLEIHWRGMTPPCHGPWLPMCVCVHPLVVCAVTGAIKAISSEYQHRQPSPGERVSLSKVELNNETHKSLLPTAAAAYGAHSGHIKTTTNTTGFLHLLCFHSVFILRAFYFI